MIYYGTCIWPSRESTSVIFERTVVAIRVCLPFKTNDDIYSSENVLLACAPQDVHRETMLLFTFRVPSIRFNVKSCHLCRPNIFILNNNFVIYFIMPIYLFCTIN